MIGGLLVCEINFHLLKNERVGFVGKLNGGRAGRQTHNPTLRNLNSWNSMEEAANNQPFNNNKTQNLKKLMVYAKRENKLIKSL